jgi:hypothetical protein
MGRLLLVIRAVITPDRATAIHAVDVLNDFVGDFVGGVMLWREYNAQYQAQKLPLTIMVNVQKICLSHLVVSFSKVIEFYERFHQLLSPEHRSAAKGLIRDINQKGILDFRNKCVGHIWDVDAGRPLVHSEIMSRLGRMTNDDMDGFLKWINDPHANVYPATVVSILETVRDALMAQYSIAPDEVINR